jgi:thiamine transport system substrate-binding protein
MHTFRRLLFVVAVLALFSGLVQSQSPVVVTLLTHDSFNVSEDVLQAFEAEAGIRLEILRGGDAGQIVNQAILTRTTPLADVLFGVDNTFLSRALAADLFLPYTSPGLATVPEAFIVDADHRVTPVDYGDVCLNYDIAYFASRDLALPASLSDLTLPAYRGLLVTMNPATSSPGLAFLLTTIAAFGTEGDYTYLDYWADLVANETLIVDGWSEAYFGEFTAGSDEGRYPLVVSYASSPPFTYDETTDAATTASLIADGMCFRQIEFAGILRGTDAPAAAQQVIDFLLSQPFQEDLPLQMYVFPVQPAAQLPDVFTRFAQLPEEPAQVPAEDIELYREDWIQAWTEVVLGR